MINPVIPVPTTGIGPDVPNDAKFTEPISASDPGILVQQYGVTNIDSFVANFDKSTLTPQQKKELIDETKASIEWVIRKLAFKLRKPMWQDENNARSKEKLIRMFNKFVQKRLNLLQSLGSQF